jgi:hypothetical protein
VYPDIAGCTYLVPASRRLLDESIVLELRAEEIERRPVTMAGVLHGNSVADLIEQAFEDALRLAPSPIELQAWCDEQERVWIEAKAYPSRSRAVIASRVFSIQFSDGRVDTERSSAEFRPRAIEVVA